MDKARVVAFDIDGTLLHGQSGTLILKYLMARHLVRFRNIALCSWWGIRYKLHLPYRQNEPRERIFSDLSQYTPEGIHRIMEMFHDDVMVPRYHADGLARLAQHVSAGDHVALVSATFEQVAQVAREHLGCEAAMGTVMERDEKGRFTGAVWGETPAGEEKVRRLKTWADAAFGPGGWVLTDAYGDHHTDEPMLQLAQTPHAVNPDLALRRRAKELGWETLSWE
jgi:HAD superfamily hydrolase (TIGR01490 family)